MKVHIKVNDQDVNDVLETASSVKGEKFASFVKFLVSARQAFEITSLLLHATIEENMFDEETIKKFKEVTTANFAQMTLYSCSMGEFTEEESKEAINLCEVILKKVNK
jgi:hypothetical protein